MKIVFAGTPEFAVPCLRACANLGEVVAAYTQPDRPAGRGRGLQPSPVKLEAVKRGIPVHQPENFRSATSKAELRALQPDVMVVVAYGLLLPQSVLDIPMHGCWNVHASLLPRWRGAAPIQRAIEAGDSRTGVCLMQMEKGLDTGPVLLAQAIDIGPAETGGQLHDRLSELGARVLGDALGLLRATIQLPPHPQPEEGATYALAAKIASSCPGQSSRMRCASQAGHAASLPAGGRPSRCARRSTAFTIPAWCGRPSARAASTLAATAACAGNPISSWAKPACSKARNSWSRVSSGLATH